MPIGLSLSVNAVVASIPKRFTHYSHVLSIPEGLVVRPFSPPHYEVTPAFPMSFDMYQDLIRDIELGSELPR